MHLHTASDGSVTRFGRWMPSPASIVFGFVVALACAFFSDSLLNRPLDGDVPRHIAHGQRMLQQGRLLTTDPFSFTMPGAPILESEYGFQIIVAWMYNHFGLISLGLISVLLLGATYAVSTNTMLRSGVPPSLMLLALGLSIWMSSRQWVARPHLVSQLFLAIVLWQYFCGKNRRPLWIIPFYVLWANLHPGWLYSLVFVGVLSFGHLVEFLIDRKSEYDKQQFFATAWICVAGGISSFITPHGYHLHQHLRAVTKMTYTLDNITEWRSPNFHGTFQLPLMLGILGVVIALGLSERRLRMPTLMIIAFQVQQALYSSRNKPMFGLVALTFVVIHVAPEWVRLRDRFVTFAAKYDRVWTAPYGAWGYASGVGLVVLLALTHGHIGRYEVMPTQFSSVQYPMTLIARSRANNVQGRLYTNIQWAGYIDLAWPEQKIFIDGSGDFFGDDILRQSMTIQERSAGWQDMLKKWDIELMLLPRNSMLAREVAAIPGWRQADADSTAVLLSRRPN